ncbi:hypothetical protein SAMN05421879_10334 [Ornithinimicrobium cerasi]|uniref:Uncharacterized protein n=1 Tax=Ornithinimicrobium cerasi TaxID=2248773 RepID=A0A285VK65_9MICO|nr:hypothetical protein SAMN05421879_10334 [Ornithinimicrobium cerasi]
MGSVRTASAREPASSSAMASSLLGSGRATSETVGLRRSLTSCRITVRDPKTTADRRYGSGVEVRRIPDQCR